MSIYMYGGYPYPPCDLNQFFGLRAKASNVCWRHPSHVYTVEMFKEDFPQFFKTTTSVEPSTFARDPSNIGGPGVLVVFDGLTAYVSGTIAWYSEDTEIGRPAGNRVGFEIIAPTDVTDVSNAIFQIDDGPLTLLSSDPNISGNPRIFWWYPLVELDTEQHILKMDWDGLGDRGTETFTINYSDFILESAQTEPEPLVLSREARTILRAESEDDVVSIVPDHMLEQFILMAIEAITDCHWGSRWRWAMGLYVAHYATLYLQSYKPISDSNDPESAAGSGGLVGVVQSAQLGDASVKYDVNAIVSATADWGAWNATTYGQLLVTESRFRALGGSFII